MEVIPQIITLMWLAGLFPISAAILFYLIRIAHQYQGPGSRAAFGMWRAQNLSKEGAEFRIRLMRLLRLLLVWNILGVGALAILHFLLGIPW